MAGVAQVPFKTISVFERLLDSCMPTKNHEDKLTIMHRILYDFNVASGSGYNFMICEYG